MTISVLSQKGKVQPSVPERRLPNPLLVALVPCWVLFLGTVDIKHWAAFLVVTTERFPHTEIFPGLPGTLEQGNQLAISLAKIKQTEEI